jgi:hypothetical protein
MTNGSTFSRPNSVVCGEMGRGKEKGAGLEALAGQTFQGNKGSICQSKARCKPTENSGSRTLAGPAVTRPDLILKDTAHIVFQIKASNNKISPG